MRWAGRAIGDGNANVSPSYHGNVSKNAASIAVSNGSLSVAGTSRSAHDSESLRAEATTGSNTREVADLRNDYGSASVEIAKDNVKRSSVNSARGSSHIDSISGRCERSAIREERKVPRTPTKKLRVEALAIEVDALSSRN